MFQMGISVWKFCLLFFMIDGVFSNLNSKRQDTLQSHSYDILRIIKRIITESHTSTDLQTLNHEYAQLLHGLDNFENDRNFSHEKLREIFTQGSISTKCINDFMYIFQNLGNISNPWALKFIDSYGKPESGILELNLKWPGDFTECISIHVPPERNSGKGNFNGQYCFMQWSLALPNFSFPLSSGICIPDTCNSYELLADVLELLIKARAFPVLNKFASAINITSLACQPNSRNLNTPAIAVICLISFFTFLAVLGSSITAYEYFFPKSDSSKRYSSLAEDRNHSYAAINNDIEKKANDDTFSDDELLLRVDQPSVMSGILRVCKEILQCFCMFKNASKLLNTDNTEGQLLSIHGIRFLSMSWVILCHTYAFSITSIRSISEVLPLVDPLAFQVILQGFYSVDSFFVLSGFLLTYLFMKDYTKRKGDIPWIYFYVHRFVRLTPVYMMVLAFSSTVYFYMGSGPFWPTVDVDPVCKKNWWWNLLYINNFVKQSNMCMGWSWYLANDMQFFVISPLILIALCKWPKIGLSLIGVFMCGTWLSNFLITYHYDLMAGMNDIEHLNGDIMQVMLKYAEWFDKIYVKPYTRIGPYLIGMLVGYFLFKAQSCQQKKFSPAILYSGWAVATTIGLTCVYVLYHKDLTVLAASFYNAFNRMCYGLALAWVIYVCCTDQGGVVNGILSFKLFMPLSRLTYCAYLIHPLIVTGYFTSLKLLVNFTHETMVVLFLGFLVITYGISFLVSLIFESPVITLEKLLRNKLKS